MSESTESLWQRFVRYFPMLIALALTGFILIQFVRFFVPDFELDNPPVELTVAWDSPETEALWSAACHDCHSNETVYPWYSYVAPVGWLVAHDTHEGRGYLNVSIDETVDIEEMVEQIEKGDMPMPIYTITHTDARMTDEQRETLIAGIRATFADMDAGHGDDDDDDDD